MEASTHEGEALPFIVLRPAGAADAAGYPLVVLLHGFGASMYDLTSLAPAIDAEGYVYAFPNAPYSVDLGFGQPGYSWAVGRPGVETPPPGAPDVESLLERAMTEIVDDTRAESGHVVLGGFSQGGGLTLRYGLLRPETFAGLAVLSGFFRDADAVRPNLPPSRALPIFVAHGTLDQMVGGEAGRLTKAFLEEAGYAPEYHEYDMAHQIVAEEVDDLRTWLHATLPPKS